MKDDDDAMLMPRMWMLPGAYNVSSALTIIFRALLKFPEVQRELDRRLCSVLGLQGSVRLPLRMMQPTYRTSKQCCSSFR